MSHYYSTHYFRHTLNIDDGIEWASEVAELIINDCKPDGFPILFYRGMSGTSLATMVAVEIWKEYGIKPGMVYIRKEFEGKESYRSSEKEYALPDTLANPKLYFVDDCIDSGKTFLRSVECLRTHVGINKRTDDESIKAVLIEPKLCSIQFKRVGSDLAGEVVPFNKIDPKTLCTEEGERVFPHRTKVKFDKNIWTKLKQALF